eukprot:CAMPEP_0181115628 /NCGR_PEP_ID=MMETSP1071-20121207/21530_1 /TAXON_ID=35127 /ORGANISM="Thalassiosira sp., Strain NH16" /LENGTH=97 /DNA_ID=CAMNT_0023199841 /DNA_START=269 /DNA_END=560 /DNA_ORIENTATION=-
MTRDLPMLLSQPKVETDDVDDIELKHEDTRSTSCSSGDYDDDDEGDSEQGLFNVNGGGGGGGEEEEGGVDRGIPPPVLMASVALVAMATTRDVNSDG